MDWVACIACKEKKQFRSIESHWSCSLHKPDYPNIEDKVAMCYCLQDAKDKNSEIIYPSDDEDDEESAEDDADDEGDEDDDDATLKPLTIPAMFDKLAEKEKVKSEMMSNDSYLYDQILKVIDDLKQSHEKIHVINE